MEVLHLTDLHLDCAVELGRFDEALASLRAEVDAVPEAPVVITGDIATGTTFQDLLPRLWAAIGRRRTLFVLGNHDAWGTGIARSRLAAANLSRKREDLTYLGATPAVVVSDVAFVGVDGWYDCRAGDVNGTTVRMNDWAQVDEFRGLHLSRIREVCGRLAQRDTHRAEGRLRVVLNAYDRVVFVTHVPPFPEACAWPGGASDRYHLPYFCNFTLGLALSRVAADYPSKSITVLCGHGHGAADVRVADNLRVVAGAAEYGCPRVSDVVEVP